MEELGADADDGGGGSGGQTMKFAVQLAELARPTIATSAGYPSAKAKQLSGARNILAKSVEPDFVISLGQLAQVIPRHFHFSTCTLLRELPPDSI